MYTTLFTLYTVQNTDPLTKGGKLIYNLINGLVYNFKSISIKLVKM